MDLSTRIRQHVHEFITSIRLFLRRKLATHAQPLPAVTGSQVPALARHIAFKETVGDFGKRKEIAVKKPNMTKNEKQILEKILEDNCKCSICLEVFKEPYELTCGHMYCFKCFEDWARQKQTTCPLCRQVISSSPVKCEAFAVFIADVMKACKPPNRPVRSMGNERTPAPERRTVQACKRPVWRY